MNENRVKGFYKISQNYCNFRKRIIKYKYGDGTKDVPADRLGPRQRYKDAIEQIIAEPHDPNMVKPCVESKVFGQEFQRDHSTVVYSIKTMAENITKDQHLKEMCSDIMKNVRT